MSDQEIKQHLSDMYERVRNLLPPELAAKFTADAFFAGGAIVNLVLGVPVVDYDVFIKTQEVTDLFRKWAESKPSLPEGVEVRAVTTNAVTFKFPDEAVFQVVTRFVGPPSRVFNDFDFTHTKCYYDLSSGELVYNDDIIRNKLLRYDGVKDKFTLNTLKRLVKFTNRGWKVDNQSLIMLHKACAKNDLDDPAVMRELSAGFYGSSFE